MLLTGDPSIIFLVGPIVHYYTGGKINLLKWDRQEKVYYPVPINFNEKGEINDYMGGVHDGGTALTCIE